MSSKNTETDKQEESTKTPTKLTKENLEFLETKGSLPEWTDARFAEKFGCSVSAIKKQRKRLGIHRYKTYDKKPHTGIDLLPSEINKANISDEKKVELWRAYCLKSESYKRWVREFTSEDLIYFVDQWSRYHLQFDSLKASEEKDVETLITLDIRLSSTRQALKRVKEEEERLVKELGGGNMELDCESDEYRDKYELILSNNRMELELNKEIRELMKSRDVVTKSLNATREQREQKEKIGGDTFLGLVEMLSKQEQREKIGEHNELMRLATEKELARLKQPYKFPDGEEDKILLDGNDYVKPKE